MNKSPSRAQYTAGILVQMVAVLAALIGLMVWQSEVIQRIYFVNQVNAVGWTVNGGIVALFLCGFMVLVRRFVEYREQEINLLRFSRNIDNDDDPMSGVSPQSLIAQRYRTLLELNRRRAEIQQGALASALFAVESSRNSFPKFVHNVLILTGVFGTIVSLSLALFGASDLISDRDGGGLGAMIYGMSTALSTTLSAIIAYLIFGYFYIKLTDTQTYLISRIEEISAVVLLPRLQPNQEAAVLEYNDGIRSAGQLIARFDQTQQQYEQSVQILVEASEALAQHLQGATPTPPPTKSADADTAVRLEALLKRHADSVAANTKLLGEAVELLREGFRLRK